ncbi:MAG: TIGR00730 family Rossman fold protein [Peptostreptococcus sp.]|uniref:LOG family protein n=1 Tax=Peptostreptococcus sp. TaxID=1262 RepID=UPI002FC84A55
MNITVYCGSSMGNNELYRNSAVIVGTWIAKNNHTLVYGGGASGLMRLLADTVLENGGKVLGVRPDFLADLEPAHPGITQLIKVENMSERKKIMIENGDAYIALPGGLGTIEEISEVLSWAMIGRNSNPCIIFNSGGFYDDLKKQFEKMVDSGFLTKENERLILFSNSMEEIEDYIKNYKLKAMNKK